MLTHARTIMRIRGIPVRLDASWLLISVLLAWSFWARFTLEHAARGRYQVGVAFAMAIVATLLFGGSVLAHEVAHALVAKQRGLEVESITLYLWGGATETLTEARRSGDEFAFTAAGPLTNIILAGIFWLIAYLGSQLDWRPVAYVAGELGWLNLLLGAFNLVPGSPLDGGRLLEAVVWKVTGDRVRATMIAAGAGQVLGTLLLGIAVFELFFVLGGASAGIWLGLTGWFILQGARAEAAQAEMQRLLAGVPAGRLAFTAPTVGAGEALSQVVEERFQGGHVDAVIVREQDRTTGVLTFDDVRRVPHGRWAATTAGQVAVPLDSLPAIASDQPVTTVLSQLARRPVVVLDEGRAIGLLTMQRAAAAAERIQQLGRMAG
jgi:Zn-dependent protease